MSADEEQVVEVSARSSHTEFILDSATIMPGLTITLPEGPDIQQNYKADGSLDLTKRWTKVNVTSLMHASSLHTVIHGFLCSRRRWDNEHI
jgi:hypothetical protein